MRTITQDLDHQVLHHALSLNATVTVRYIAHGKRARVTYAFKDHGQAERFMEAFA